MEIDWDADGEIDLGAIGADVEFHPSKNLVATSLFDGRLQLYRYNPDSPPLRVVQVQAHRDFCSAVRFIDDGQRIVTASCDRSILVTDVESGAAVYRLENAHERGVNALINVTETTTASGADDGCIKIWDFRQRSCCKEFKLHRAYIYDMTCASDSMKLVATSHDGTLSVCNLRSNKVQYRSPFSRDELLSVVIMKNGSKVICGAEHGNLLLYSWGRFERCSDWFDDLGYSSVEDLVKFDEERVIAGCYNGFISLVGIGGMLPNRIIQRIGVHERPIQSLALSFDRMFLGSTSLDRTLKLWDLNDILEEGNEAGFMGGNDSDESETSETLFEERKRRTASNSDSSSSSSSSF